ARESRRSVLSTVDGKKPASVGPAIDGGEPRGIGAEQTAQLDGGWRGRAGQHDMRDTHALEVGAMLGWSRPDQVATAIALEIERDRATPGVEPHEGLVVGRQDGSVREVLNDGQQLGEVGRDRARLGVPPPASEPLKRITDVTTGAKRHRSKQDIEPADVDPAEREHLERPREIADVAGDRGEARLLEWRAVGAIHERERGIYLAGVRRNPDAPPQRSDYWGNQQGG